ncbi:Histone acetyltransferase [Elasticomyces elasticus]|nr:Histone acetyltransferase [Elasticomyces elasticus]
MAPHATGQDPDDSVQGEKGYATLSTLRVGVKAFVQKDGEKRKAEILSIKEKKEFQYSQASSVHYVEFNKRLDDLRLPLPPPLHRYFAFKLTSIAEWITAERIDLSHEVEWPLPEKTDKQKKAAQNQQKSQQSKADGQPSKAAKRPRSSTIREHSATPSDTTQPRPLSQLGTARRAGGQEVQSPSEAIVPTEIIDGTPQPDDDTLDLVDVADAATAAKAGSQHPNLSKEDERDRLRHTGSMTQNQTEISRVRNFEKIHMGRDEIEPWYFSPYPEELTETGVIYLCETCLSYFGSEFQLRRHRKKCQLLHPPGNEIYRDQDVSFFEIDGKRQRTYCRNLCLLSKVFLDHKTVYYDVDPFLFYCMTTTDQHGHHIVGYFSKEKESADGFNVACILTLPQYQRKGYGKLLIQFSYELSKREGRLGHPEKPLSDLGLLGYRGYWEEAIVDLLVDGDLKVSSVDEIASTLAMTVNDVLHTLSYLNMLKISKNNHVIVLTNAILERHSARKAKEQLKGKRQIDPARLQWKPPVFTASSRTWNW